MYGSDKAFVQNGQLILRDADFCPVKESLRMCRAPWRGSPVNRVFAPQVINSPWEFPADDRLINILPIAGGRAGRRKLCVHIRPAAIQRLKAWVGDGGTVVGIGGAVSFLADAAVGLLAVQQEDKAGLCDSPPSGGGRGGATTPTPAVGRIPVRSSQRSRFRESHSAG